MATFLVKSPDGKTYKVNAPEGATQEQAIQYVQSNASKLQPVGESPKTNFYQDQLKQRDQARLGGFEKTKQNIIDASGGLVEGAADIGRQFLKPIDYVHDVADKLRPTTQAELITGRKPTNFGDRAAARKEAINMALSGMGADMGSTPAEMGQVIAHTIGTAGLGAGLIPEKIATKIITAVPKSAAVVKAVQTAGGGAKGWKNVPARAAGGAITGAAQSAAVDQDPRLGAAFGAGLPVATNLLRNAKDLAKFTAFGGTGLTSGAGKESVEQAYKAGVEGGVAKQNLSRHMREDLPLDEAVDMVKNNIEAIRKAASAEYTSSMEGVRESTKQLPIADVRNKLAQLKASLVSPGGYSGQSAAMTVVNKLEDELTKFSKSNARTAMDYDFFKRSIDELRKDPNQNKNALRIATEMYNHVKDKITREAPVYASVMKNYQTQQDLLREAERSLSMGRNVAKETAIRKLLQTTRHNANANFAQRQQLLNRIQQEGGQGDVNPILAGAALNAKLPAGLVARGTGLAAAGNAITNPLALLAAPAFIPRAVGETAMAAGTARRKAGNFLQALADRSPLDPGDISTLTRTAVVNAGAKKKGK